MAEHARNAPQPAVPTDYAVGDHFDGSSNRSPFVTRAFIQRILPDRLHILDGLTWTTQSAHPASRHRPGPYAPKRYAAETDDVFGIVIGDDAPLHVARPHP